MKSEELLSSRKSELINASTHLSLPTRCDLTWTFHISVCNQNGKGNK